MIDNITPATYRNKIYGGWMGKNIGGTLGGPLEGRKELMSYDFYPRLGELPLPNDDLDLQLVWLHALETYGPRLSAVELAEQWKEHVFFPYDEYGYALTNMRRGMTPPVSGWYSNPFTDCMGAPIRSEIWAMIAPGKPELAAYYAYQDGITDHAGGEGVYGEMFFAAIESAAFVEHDPQRLLEVGLGVIPSECRTAQAVKDTMRWHAEGLDWITTREKIIEAHGHINFTDAPQNIAFTVLGLLYGKDFGDAICKAVNCGYDTDCTGATLGAILGITMGADALPQKWIAPIGDAIVVSPPVKGFPAPKTVAELTERTVQVGEETAAFWKDKPIPEPAALWSAKPFQNRVYLPSRLSPSLEIVIDYGAEGPAALPGRKTEVGIRMINHASVRWSGNLKFDLPSGWQGDEVLTYALEPGDNQDFVVTLCPDDAPKATLQVDTEITRSHDNALWQTFRLPLVFARGMRWCVKGPDGESEEALFATNEIILDGPPGVYRLSSTLLCPSARESKLMLSTTAPIRAWLNYEPIFDHWQPGNPIPAYHRGQGPFVQLKEGENLVVIETEKTSDEALQLHVACVAPRQVSEPGSLFGYLDVLFM
ncbi:MAG: ADP-ribosylglycohydrolase family protein [Limnochordia bacterium]|jgi:ADP-ribosylglycohydrolase